MRYRPLTRWGTPLALALALNALPAAGQNLPIWIPGAGAPDDGCGAPTFDQCSDPEWLFSDDPCAVAQNKADSACADLLWSDMDERADNGDEVTHVVATNLVSGGVTQVIPGAFNVVAQEREYVGDLFSLTSQEAQLDYVGSQTIGVDIYAFYEANGTEVADCFEYAYETFYDVNAFQTEIGSRRGDYRFVVDTAYGPANNPASIGTRHLSNATLRGRDNVPFGVLFQPTNEPKNIFFGLVQNPAPPTADVPVPGAPPLLNSIAYRSKAALALLEKIENNKSGGDHIVQKTWAWHKQMNNLLVQPAPEPDDDQDPFATLQIGPVQNGGPAQNSQVGSYVGPNGPVPKKLDDELDGLFNMQNRVRRLVRKWAELNAEYEGSGWNVVDAGLEDDAVDLGQLLLAPQPAQEQDDQVFQDLPLNNGGGGGGIGPGNVPQLGLDYAIEDPETLARRKVLDNLIDLLIRADDEDCLRKGATPCDWSPKDFSQRILYDFGAEEDEALSWCRDFTKGNVSNVLNLEVVFVDDPEYPQFHCSIETGDDITAQQLRQLAQDVDYCREQQIAYREAKALADAKDRVRGVPELYDASTGGFKVPGIDKSRDEYMGNKYFGLGYDYGFGFQMDINSEVCNIELETGGHLDVYAKLLTFDVSLIDAAANLSTTDRVAHAHAEILGYELFQPVDEMWTELEDMHFDVVKTPKKSKRQDIINTTIVVVVVPLSVVLGISGEVGAKLGLNIDTTGLDGDSCPTVTIGGIAEPYVGISGYVSAAVDILIAAAGIRGEVNIITVKLPFKPGITLSLIGDMNGDLLPDDLVLGITANLKLILATLGGKIQAFAEIGFCPFCYTGEFTIIRWEGPRWETTLFNQVYSVGLGDLNAAFNL